ncbi:MAG: M6 family metalloprotease domain-containing protein [Kiritimatiellae bacterium]|nr:M6 family metalloprotease domain-containing protein [Kiritimatiellia bacterium]
MKISVAAALLVLPALLVVDAATPSPETVALLKTKPELARRVMGLAPAGDAIRSPFSGPGGHDYRAGRVARRLQLLKERRTAAAKAATLLAGPVPPPAPAITRLDVPVLLVDFPDQPTPYTAADLDARLFGSAYSPNMTEYYEEVSYGQLDVTGDVYGPFTMPKNFGGYTTDTPGVEEFIADAIAAADTTVDFSRYDGDGDGYVDAVLVAASDYITIWGWETAHMRSLSSPVTVDGVQVSEYTSQDDDAVVGLFCHELGHVLGLPDFYDDEQVFEWCLMGTGCYLDPPAHPSAWHKVYLGWVTPTEIRGRATGQTLRNVEAYPEIYKLVPADLPSEEYFLVENRQPIGSDAALPEDGLLVWHVGGGRSSMAVLSLEYAGAGAGDSSEEAASFPGSTGNTEFTPDSNPSSDFYATHYDTDSDIRLTDISASAPTMTADVYVPTVLHGWRAQDSGTGEDLNDVCFVDANRGWAVGNNGAIVCTTNGGTTWTAQTSPTASNLLAVFFADATHGWACGAGGKVIRTTDGSTWWPCFSGTTDRLVDLSFPSLSRGYCIGTNGTVRRTINGGLTWTDISPDFYGDIPCRVSFVSTTTGFIACQDEQLLYTDDGGATWSASSLAWPGADGFYAWADNFICYVNSMYFTVNFEGHEASARVRDSSTWRMNDVDFSGARGMILGQGLTVALDLAEDFFWPETDASGYMDALEDQPWAEVHDLFTVLSNSTSAIDVSDSTNPFLTPATYVVGSGGMILKHIQPLALYTNVGSLSIGDAPGSTPNLISNLVTGIVQEAPREELITPIDQARYAEFQRLILSGPRWPDPIP